ncbi:MAG: hypothetical protein ACRD1M_08195 [Terriglobales bacterium]
MKVPLVCGLAVLMAAAQVPNVTYAGRKAWIIKRAGTTTVTTQLRGEALTVAIHTWQVPVKAGPLVEHRPYPQCTYSQDPCSITDSIQVTLGGHKLWVGQDQLAGLGDIHYLSIAGSPAHLELRIAGGDGADGYDAHLIFDGDHVAERALYGIDQQHPFEVTHYYYETIN